MTKFIEQRTVSRAASKPIVILYHAECTDGFGAAWAAFKRFGMDAEYFPVEHQYPVPGGLRDKEIYMLDFTYPRAITDELSKANRRVTSVDHHISVADVTRDTQDGCYGSDHSGAVLAWKYFHPDQPVPKLLEVIEDHDLHRFSLNDTEVLFDWLDQFDFQFEVYDTLVQQLESDVGYARAVQEGSVVMRYRQKLIERMISNTAYEVDLEGHRAGVVNTELFHGDVANRLAEKYGLGIAWRVRPHGVYVSLRSEGDINVADIATHYGGGGHEHSGGFVVRHVEDLPFERIEVENGNGKG